MSEIDVIERALDLLIQPGRTTTQRELAAQIAVALCDSDYRIVPVVPTAEMWAAVNLVERDAEGRGRILNLCSAEGWRAMLAAARLAE